MSVSEDPRDLRSEIRRKRQELDSLNRQLAQQERTCRHDWTAPEYTPDVQEGYQDPGDPEGTMGVDRRLPMWVPRQETPKWTRTCRKCGKVETTTRAKKERRVIEHPQF